MLRLASKRHCELRNNLRKKVLVFSQQQNKANGQDEHLEEMVLYGSNLKRAFLGRLPKVNDESESRGSNSSSSANRQGDSNRTLASNRARSLLSLARQLRSDGAGLIGDADRLTRSELLQQALLSTGNAGISNDVLDELNETVFASLPGLSADSLSRARLSLQERDQSRTSREANALSGEEATRTSAKDDKKSTSIGECSRLYSQMREAERGKK
jgi:hypothetical protein